ncbi:winged helix-turn-helix domain-containing protein [Ornithinibacillus halotolerans]|uniref:OmpR/PhoB-type domain-containing protein n=1 Tax=Ornithinibacillus halotolerans TaxID=1274357 RepID=A0A916SBQ4_9BACI|nr:winged helix-turn-helix domain-containing protein [Ornithinibacillus halotolerans]GGA90320.1 hypothetical protein GCM10008025_36110 [Ornithinibacillus halotolerans]
MQKQIMNWKNKEGLIDESAWLTQGIQLYRKLLQEYPENPTYKIELANLLVKSGTDQKLVDMNLMNAEKLFKEVLEIFPNHIESLYRLGHIHYELGRHQKSVRYFEKINKEELSNTKLIRTHLSLSKAYYYLADDGKAYENFERANQLDKENDFSTEIKEAKALITQNGEFRTIAHYPDGTSELMTFETSQDFNNEVDSNQGKLDLVEFRATFTGPADTLVFPRREAEILRYILERKTPVTIDDIARKVWEEKKNNPNPKTVKSYISNINQKLRRCIGVEENPIISKRGQGYIWNSINVIVTTRIQ